MPIIIQNASRKFMCSDHAVKKMYCQGNVIYSAGNTVTYHVDTGIVYQEEVDEGEFCIPPKSFTPTKTGWEFAGWREDSAANGNLLNNKVMGDEPIHLYAVFRQTITVTYYNASTVASKTSAYRLYNNGNITNPSFTLTQAAWSGWTARGWSTSNAGNAAITYNNGASFTRDSNITLYGLYQLTITLSYSGNGNTGGSTAAQTGTRYWAPAGYINPSFTLSANGFSKTGYNFSKWALGSAGGTQYAVGATITLSASNTVYAVWVEAPIVANNAPPFDAWNAINASGEGVYVQDKTNTIHWYVVATNYFYVVFESPLFSTANYSRFTMTYEPYYQAMDHIYLAVKYSNDKINWTDWNKSEHVTSAAISKSYKYAKISLIFEGHPPNGSAGFGMILKNVTIS